MGRSTASFFKIIGCGCDPVVKDDPKGPSDKSCWSFKKSSARDHVLSEIVASETESFLNKEIPETVNEDFMPQSDLTVPDKASSITLIEEKPNLSASMELHESGIEKDKAVEATVNLDESGIEKDKEVEATVNLDESAIEKDKAVEATVNLDESAIEKDKAGEATVNLDEPAIEKDKAVEATVNLDEPAIEKDKEMEATVNLDESVIENDKAVETIVNLDESAIEKDKAVEAIVNLDDSAIEKDKAVEASVNLDESAIEKDKAVEATVNLDESAVVSLQVAIRTFLAQNQLLKLRNVVKLQATVRGHLVRRHAVGTLRCLQAIVKIQAHVRSHQAHVRSHQAHVRSYQALRRVVEKHNFGSMRTELKGNVETSIDKLLSNKFACKLLESTPRTKRIYIEYDSSKANSTSKWLDRWNTVLSRGFEQLHKPESNDNSVIVESEEENLITYDVDDFDFLAWKPQSQNQNEQHADSFPQQQPVDCQYLTSFSRRMMKINSFSPMNPYDCGTELSISSTLDSLYMLETGPTDVPDIKPVYHSIQPIEINNIGSTNVNQSNGDKLKSELGYQVFHSSIETSLSSQASSASIKKDRRDRNMLGLNPRSLSSSSKVSYQQLTMGGKRNNYFDLGKSDTFDQESRDSCSSNSLPSYMQHTESTRAKAIAYSSPRSSPNVQDKDIISIKKINGQYGSPNVQRSISRVQQGSKGNGHPTERKWQR